jgi:hypothetical protein
MAPAYSEGVFSYGSEDRLVTVMGVMQALVSFVANEGDSLKCDLRYTALEHPLLMHRTMRTAAWWRATTAMYSSPRGR